MNTMLDLDTLIQQTSLEAIEEARNAMDLLSVSAYQFDKRGRIEGGVKPAPPSTEPSSYVRISRRGSRFLVDCRKHGRGSWCLHAVILALHHIGDKPNYQVKRPAKSTQDLPKIGYRAEARFDQAGAHIRLKSMSTNTFVHNPLAFLKREPGLAPFPKKAFELMDDLADEAPDAFHIARLDLAPLLAQLDISQLFQPNGEPYQKGQWQGDLPEVEVRVDKNHIHWKMSPPPTKDTLYAPGWPGYLIQDSLITRCPGYIPDFQHLSGGAEGSLDLSPKNLLPFIRHKHAIRWISPKPDWIRDPEGADLQLTARNGMLHGQLGFRLDDRFLPLKNTDHSEQLHFHQGRPVLLSFNAFRLSELSRDLKNVRAPWQGARFEMRELPGKQFLESAEIPRHWRVDRVAADRDLGVTRLGMETHWGQNALKPKYRIGDQWFNHDDLIHQISGSGLKLPDGRTLNVDVNEILKNDKVLDGVRAMHDDESAQLRLIERITGQQPSQPAPSLDPKWLEQLRGYQIEGVQWLLANHNHDEPSLLADDMGLGKTIQTLAWLDTIRADLPQLVVVPTSLLFNWRAEAKKFTPNRKLTIHHGPKRTRDAESLQNADLIITTYGVLRMDLEMLYDVQFQAVVIDEAQAIKNAASQTARAVCELWTNHRLALTGTPVENRLTELWSIFHFLAPDYLGDEEEVKQITTPGTPAYLALKAKVAPFLKRRLKTEVAKDLPPKQEITVTLPLTDNQSQLYSQALKPPQGEDYKKANTVSILTKLLRLRQIACHPGLIGDQLLNASSNKLDFLLESLADITGSGHAALVFSQFTQFLKLVRYKLEENDISNLYLDGQTNNRQDLVERFQQGEANVFLISLKAGGTGLNLTRASYVYILDPWWNPMAEAQAVDRAHRIGQSQKVISYKLISQNTVEEKILKLQASKRLLADGLWDDNQLQSLDKETLLSLLT